MSFESEVEERIGVTFKHPELLRQAFVHRSYMNEYPSPGLESNERLEFFGDSVLSYVVAERLFRDCPTCQEGELTEWRGYLVRRDSLAAFAQRIGLGEFFLLGRGEEAAGGRERPQNMASLFEAVGADSGAQVHLQGDRRRDKPERQADADRPEVAVAGGGAVALAAGAELSDG